MTNTEFINQITAPGFDIKTIGTTDNPEVNLAELKAFADNLASIQQSELPIGLGWIVGCYGAYIKCRQDCGGAYPCSALCDEQLNNCINGCTV